MSKKAVRSQIGETGHTFSTQIYPKINILWLEFLRSNCGIRISSSKIQSVLIFTENGQF